MRFMKRLVLAVFVVFLMPALATLAWWQLQDRPGSYRNADWTSAGILPAAASDGEAAIYLLAARTGGLKGAFAVHSWIVFKEAGATRYQRYDKVGWGNPIRHNAYAADARWYSNTPVVLHEVHGADAQRLIPGIEKAIASYPYAERGGYRSWPGPNSNSFVAHVLRMVPEFGGRLPPNAVGRDFAPGLWALDISADWLDWHFTLGGFAGVSVGRTSGLEVHLAGLVAGVDLWPLALKVPALGLIGWPR